MALASNNRGGKYTYNMAQASDYNQLVDWYASQIPGFSHYYKNIGDIITAADWQNLKDYILSFSSTWVVSELPDDFHTGDLIKSTTWGPAVSAQKTVIFTQNGTLDIPTGITSIRINMILAGGGGGGAGNNTEYGSSGGSGASGGYYQNKVITVTSGTMNVNIGVGGTGSKYDTDSYFGMGQGNGGNGGDSSLVQGGSTLLSVSGGGGGECYVSNSHDRPSNGGTAGSPNGTAGTEGIKGHSRISHTSSTAGVPGASSPMGQGGAGGVVAKNTNPINCGSDATGYGAGGGSGANCDSTGKYSQWGGGSGTGGYCSITYPA